MKWLFSKVFMASSSCSNTKNRIAKLRASILLSVSLIAATTYLVYHIKRELVEPSQLVGTLQSYNQPKAEQPGYVELFIEHGNQTTRLYTTTSAAALNRIANAVGEPVTAWYFAPTKRLLELELPHYRLHFRQIIDTQVLLTWLYGLCFWLAFAVVTPFLIAKSIQAQG